MGATGNPLSPALGAEITGALLTRSAAETDFDVLRQALLDHLVVVVRDQALARGPDRAVNHRACGGYDDDDIRLMHRTTVLGDAPY